jgi:hypothetical protein
MINPNYEAANSKKTMCIKQVDDDYIICAIFVDDLKSSTANNQLAVAGRILGALLQGC